MPAVNIKLENKLLETLQKILSLRLNEELNIHFKDGNIALKRVG